MDDGKVRAVLVGCGGISGGWFDAAAKIDDLEFVGLVDLNLENAEKRKKEFGLDSAVVGDSLTEILDQVEAQVVFDCTVPEAHMAVTVESLNRGCHVLGEKPMADTMENAAKMLTAAKDNDQIYAVIQNRRYLSDIIRYQEVVQSGELGKLTTLNADFFLGPHFGGFREEMDHVLILDMAIHTFDQARLISGKDPVRVLAYEWNPSGSWFKHGASAAVIFQMTDGAVFNYRGSWCANGLPTTWEADWRAICEEGTAKWDGGQQIEAQKIVRKDDGFTGEGVAIEIPEFELEVQGHGAIIQEFVDCVKNGGIPQTICTDNVKSLAMVHAAIESADTGKWIEIK